MIYFIIKEKFTLLIVFILGFSEYDIRNFTFNTKSNKKKYISTFSIDNQFIIDNKSRNKINNAIII